MFRLVLTAGLKVSATTLQDIDHLLAESGLKRNVLPDQAGGYPVFSEWQDNPQVRDYVGIVYKTED